MDIHSYRFGCTSVELNDRDAAALAYACRVAAAHATGSQPADEPALTVAQQQQAADMLCAMAAAFELAGLVAHAHYRLQAGEWDNVTLAKARRAPWLDEPTEEDAT